MELAGASARGADAPPQRLRRRARGAPPECSRISSLTSGGTSLDTTLRNTPSPSFRRTWIWVPWAKAPSGMEHETARSGGDDSLSSAMASDVKRTAMPADPWVEVTATKLTPRPSAAFTPRARQRSGAACSSSASLSAKSSKQARRSAERLGPSKAKRMSSASQVRFIAVAPSATAARASSRG